MALKRKAVAKVTEEIDVQEAVQEENQPEEDDEEEEKLKQQEAQTTSARKKELKAMGAADLKELVVRKGLEPGNKANMIEVMLNHEAEARAAQREHEAKMRMVVIQKKEELEAMSASELKDLCSAKGITGVLSKSVRVGKLLQLWQQEDGVNKGLAQMAWAKREGELAVMGKAALRKLCEQRGVEAVVKEVMVERLLRYEVEAGLFARPVTEHEAKEEAPRTTNKGDVVEALLASEASRKKEVELKKQQEEAAANKRRKLEEMSLQELKKALSMLKKDDMVEALFQVGIQEEKMAARKAELNAMGKDELKQLLFRKGLETTGSKHAQAEAILAHEAKSREELKAYGAKVEQFLVKRRQELEAKTAAELKDICVNKGLKVGGGKEDCVQRLLEEARRDGDVDKALAMLARANRREELLTMESADLKKLCDQASVDATVKEVMVERLLTHEAEHGTTAKVVVESSRKRK
eukprot:TRINITY_DN754_c1_g3_i1.p1 TRINITY_DN754_c1_g3~~TRINITY_DN754_c1_g3_i1.p1  ORF type:complete len:467 (-),score=181.40 TRINITY_DN754_c1_g3_i1:141-1541(-)